ncbi:MAG: M55 family metallopeptidase [Kiritimatiellaeota bacterium]|nr:M55 family metallopeptidase [Kiritimatiellota bacterium]
MKLYIQADIEGIAGMAQFENRDDQSAENLHRRLRLRKLYTDEVNAAARGAFAGGAKHVTIWDSHGAGNSIIIEELDQRVELITGNYSRAPWLPFFLEDEYDAGMYLCAHAMAGTPFACLPHTRMVLNGKAYGEGGMFINLLASRRVPTIMVSGDQAAVDEMLKLVPQMERVVSKKALGPFIIKSRTPQAVCEEMYLKAKKAAENRKNIPVYKILPPYFFTYTKDGSEHEYRGKDENDLIDTYRRFLNTVYGYEGGNQCVGRPEVDIYLPDEYKHKLL